MILIYGQDSVSLRFKIIGDMLLVFFERQDMHQIRKLILALFVGGFFAGHVVAQTSTYKMDTGLKLMVNAIERDDSNGVLSKAAGVHLPFVSVLIKGQPLGIRGAVLQAGGSVETVVGNVVSARIRPTSIVALAENAAIERMEKVAKKHLRNDEASRQVGARHVQAGTSPLTQAYTGEGVIVGVIDSGIDFRHRDFRDSADSTKSRILYIWDQADETGPPPEGYSYGTLWTKAQLEQDFRGEITIRQADPDGHGTHVAGSAAGNGSATGKYKGTAPESEIIFVKGLDNAVDAASFIYAKAQELGRPAVINYSAGGHQGAHDGASLEEVTLENLATSVPGRAFVTAAGNEGADFIHWGGFGLETDSLWTYYMADVSGELTDNDAGGKVASFDVFGVISELNSDADAEGTLLAVGFDSAGVSGSTVTASGVRGQTIWYDLLTLLQLPGSSTDTLRYSNGEIAGIVSLTVSSTDAPTDQNKLLVTLSVIDFVASHNSDGFDAVGADLWRFMAKGKGTIHMWSEKVWTAENNWLNLQVAESRYRATDNNYTVGMPATATKLISVGAYTNLDIDTETAVHGALADFSSKGPTADGRNKPDIVSPGQFVFSAISTASSVADPTTVDEGGVHYREQGTSMASPITAGSIALYLQKNPTATYDQIFSAMTQHSIKDDFTSSNGGLPNSFWGYGKLDVFAMMTDGQPADTTSTTPADSTTSGGTVLPTGTRGPIALDLDTTAGDQMVLQTTTAPKAGDNIVVDIVVTAGASGQAGFQSQLTFDAVQLEFVSFAASDVFAGGVPINTPGAGSIDINVALLGGTASKDAGTLGQVTFKVLDGFTGETKVTLASGQLASGALEIGPGGSFVVIGGATPAPAIPTDPVERADFSGDGVIGFTDFLSFAGAFGQKTGDAGYDERIDLNGDGEVGFTDFLTFASLFGQKVGG